LTDYLFLIAELAAAFAGFTAIVSVLDARGDSRKRALDVIRLRAMLEASLATIALALLPSLLLQVGLGEAAWRWASAIGSLVVGVLYAAQVRRGFTRELKNTPGYSLVFARFLAVMGIAGLGGLIVAAVFSSSACPSRSWGAPPPNNRAPAAAASRPPSQLARAGRLGEQDLFEPRERVLEPNVPKASSEP